MSADGIRSKTFILFFDDLAENVAGARLSGMNAVQVASIDDILRGLREHEIL